MRFVRRIALMLVTVALVALAGGSALLWASGWRFFIVHTGSMTPTIPSGDLVIDRPASSAHVGDVITFAKVPGQYTTHRVAAITAQGIKTRGDANPSDDFGYMTKSQITGRAIAVIPYGGFVAAFFSHPTGVAGLVLLMCSVWLAWSLFMSEPGLGVGSARPAG